jgi:hypothetical protein
MLDHALKIGYPALFSVGFEFMQQVFGELSSENDAVILVNRPFNLTLIMENADEAP